MAFWLVFGVFLVALGTWATLLVRWARRRDREVKMSQQGGSLKG